MNFHAALLPRRWRAKDWKGVESSAKRRTANPNSGVYQLLTAPSSCAYHHNPPAIAHILKGNPFILPN
jgi:hypothetical protein